MSIKIEKKPGFGTMRLPLIDPDNPGSVDLEQFKRMADLYMERGFRCWSTCRKMNERIWAWFLTMRNRAFILS